MARGGMDMEAGEMTHDEILTLFLGFILTWALMSVYWVLLMYKIGRRK